MKITLAICPNPDCNVSTEVSLLIRDEHMDIRDVRYGEKHWRCPACLQWFIQPADGGYWVLYEVGAPGVTG